MSAERDDRQGSLFVDPRAGAWTLGVCSQRVRDLMADAREFRARGFDAHQVGACVFAARVWHRRYLVELRRR